MNWLAMETAAGRAIYQRANEGTPRLQSELLEEEG
jgi:hypothetical protein